MTSLQHKPAWLHYLQLYLSAFAVVVCLYSASNLHQHEAGYHALGADCISCDLDDLTSHGLATSDAAMAVPYFVTQQPSKHLKTIEFVSIPHSFRARAPPHHS